MIHKKLTHAPRAGSGEGADEQLAGYARHRKRFGNGSWRSLQNELEIELSRLWQRNLGRDDRQVSRYGREARFPFLDEEVIRTIAHTALPLICDLTLPEGHGEKRILRYVGVCLCLSVWSRWARQDRAHQATNGTLISSLAVAYTHTHTRVALECRAQIAAHELHLGAESSQQPKRAIQFGSRMAHLVGSRKLGGQAAFTGALPVPETNKGRRGARRTSASATPTNDQ